MIQALQKILGDPNERKVRQYRPSVKLINSLEIEIASLSDEQLKAKTTEFRQRLDSGEPLDDLMVEAFAVVREAGKRVLGLRHYDVQLIGGMVLHKGEIAEMKTGEGKTLVSTLPAYLNGLTGKGVHIVTVNDYLARRDAELMGQVHRYLGLSVGLIQNGMPPSEKKRNYACDITYCTNSELGFDYLRDNMATTMQEVVQRPFNYCIIDEVDSILVDEARTPLIISGQVERPTEKYMQAAEIASQLEDEDDYEVDEKARNVILTDEGFEKAEELLGVTDLFDPKDPWAHYIFNAVKAKELFTKDVNYIVRNKEVVIVDEFTGRVMAGRRWSDGLHQALEAKEHVPIQKETQTLASITYQNLFLLYPKLSGMTGTAKTEEAEFGKTYNLEVTVVPTNEPNIRRDAPDVVYKNEQAKWIAVANEIEDMYEQGRPVLVGTTSVEKSETLSAILTQMKIPHNLLNAKPENVERESEIVAQAGRKGGVTISTNMAGRGTDIILGGNADFMARLKVRERLMPKLIQLDPNDPMSGAAGAGRGKKKGFSPGKKPKNWTIAPEFYPCELSDKASQQLDRAVEAAVAKYGANRVPELQVEEILAIASEKAPVNDPVVLQLREAFQQIRSDYQVITDAEHEEVVNLGGLHVIGTERHESRRIDNQLRGRSARQGDPGSTRFFLGLEDNLLRIFGGDRIGRLMDMFRVEDDMPIEHPMLTGSLENAQKKVETYYYDIRKQVFEYDEVMNNQRKAIYAERRRALEGDNLKQQMLKYCRMTMEEVVRAYVNPELPPEEWEMDKLVGKIKEFVPQLNQLKASDIEELGFEDMNEYLAEQIQLAYEAQESYVDTFRPGLMRDAERFFLLQQIDTLWREHLQQMDALRESVGLRGYGQKDPLIEYKNEGYQQFLDMMTDIRRNTVYSLFQFKPQVPAAAQQAVTTAESGVIDAEFAE
ncbi:preprotein translocase subunit SecA [Synechococcus sp. PCC 7336]|uniref:preprotein translocase subunit SecA n=1 Tax=Synechococcus sp. PCC 7336 TaxID=195250 RepID=UPI000348F12A|nr:preprotein translocase subunit SecA [Synechococcus sp. PCC 7336]